MTAVTSKCPKSATKLHHWQRDLDGSAVCLKCAAKLNLEQAHQLFTDDNRRGLLRRVQEFLMALNDHSNTVAIQDGRPRAALAQAQYDGAAKLIDDIAREISAPNNDLEGQ